jgi:hypothetical protein
MIGSSLRYHPTACALFPQVKNPTAIEAFEKHHGYFMDDELQGLDSSARAQKVLSIYSTMLFVPLNEHRFGPGTVAQKLGGFEWRWWLRGSPN